jgi:hypothetical protein
MVVYNHLEEGFHPHPRNCHHGQQRNTMHAPYIYEVAERSPQQQFKDNTTMGHNLMRVIYKVSSCYLHSSEKPLPKQLHQLWTVGVDKYIITMNATST